MGWAGSVETLARIAAGVTGPGGRARVAGARVAGTRVTGSGAARARGVTGTTSRVTGAARRITRATSPVPSAPP
ncbi:hypothetical protein, partial [Streptomyces javensis]|uniref:hypothetical protein n=1 Tax=Streptomyces javensis TaxID=114698 RepID=UPI0031D46237